MLPSNLFDQVGSLLDQHIAISQPSIKSSLNDLKVVVLESLCPFVDELEYNEKGVKL